MFHSVESLNLQYKGTQVYLKAVEKRANNSVDDGTKLPKIIRFTRIFKEAI